MSELETVIGLEVHVQLKTKAKIFCACSTQYDQPANTNICPVCCGYPGVLPVFNKRVLEVGTRVALALNCQLNRRIYFERKNYFYPDLPKGYQISQYKLPLGINGYLELPTSVKIRINRVHLEEDAGKLIHKDNCSLVDLNRAGTPLLEIVTEPDISDPNQAHLYLQYLKLTLQYINASDCDMEKGSLRCDANVSLRKKGETKLGTKVELKNMNSFSGVKDALIYEEIRQAKAISLGEKIFQETRLWDDKTKKTQVMRTKEEAHDYRYFPEPDLVDFTLSDEMILNAQKSIDKLPLALRNQFLAEYKLSEKEIDIIIADKQLADFFQDVCKYSSDPKKVANFLLGPFLEQVNNLGNNWQEVKISSEQFAKIVNCFSSGQLNNITAKKVLSLSITTNRDIDQIIKEEGLVQISGQEALESLVMEAIANNDKAIKEYQAGKPQAIMFIVGQIMKKSQGKANPQIVRQMLEEKIKNIN